MKTIYKYNLKGPNEPEEVIELPLKFKFLHLGMQGGCNICMWVMVDSDEEDKTKVRIKTYGTGHPLPDYPGEYLGTVNDSPFIWHLFMELV